MNGVAIGIDTADHYFTMFIFQLLRFQATYATAFGGFLPGAPGIIYAQRQYFYTITMFVYMIGHTVARA
jgi:hypothetical protein